MGKFGGEFESAGLSKLRKTVIIAKYRVRQVFADASEESKKAPGYFDTVSIYTHFSNGPGTGILASGSYEQAWILAAQNPIILEYHQFVEWYNPEDYTEDDYLIWGEDWRKVPDSSIMSADHPDLRQIGEAMGKEIRDSIDQEIFRALDIIGKRG